MNRDRRSRRYRTSSSKKNRLKAFGGLTFYKDFSNQTVLADYSVGSPTGTFTRSPTSDVATYIDGDGVIRTAVASSPRYQGGYYDDTGFHAQKGLMIEGATTNRATYSSTPENAAWTKTNITADNDDAGSSSPDGTATANRLLATANNGTFVQAYPITGAAATYTASCWLKRKTGTGAVYLGAVEDGTGKAEKTITTEWTRHQVTATTDGDDAGKDPAFYLELAVDTDAVYIDRMQLELGPYATSHVPSATTAATRNLETLTYLISGNRTAATESIFVKFAPESIFANDGIERWLDSTDTSIRQLRKSTTSALLTYRPRSTDASVLVNSVTIPDINTSYVAAAVCQHASPYAKLYFNGSADGTPYTGGDFTDPGWGTKFWVGSNNASANQLNGIIQAIAVFSDAKDATQVSTITNIINS